MAKLINLKQVINNPNVTLDQVKELVDRMPFNVQLFNPENQIVPQTWSHYDVMETGGFSEKFGHLPQDEQEDIAIEILGSAEGQLEDCQQYQWDILADCIYYHEV